MQLFTIEGAWDGGFYQLAIEIGEHSDQRLDSALQAIWNYNDLQGCYIRRDIEPEAQNRLTPSAASAQTLTEGFSPLFGVAITPGNRRIPCQTYIVREDDGPDWIRLDIPLGALAKVYGVGGYPFGLYPDTSVWRKPLDEWLVTLAQNVFDRVDFRLALVGFEASGTFYWHDIQTSGLPQQRRIGYVLKGANGLIWYPPNEYAG